MRAGPPRRPATEGQAQTYYAKLLQLTDGGAQSTRPEFDHVKSVVASAKLAVK